MRSAQPLQYSRIHSEPAKISLLNITLRCYEIELKKDYPKYRGIGRVLSISRLPLTRNDRRNGTYRFVRIYSVSCSNYLPTRIKLLTRSLL
jgi:hypothetical protein